MKTVGMGVKYDLAIEINSWDSSQPTQKSHAIDRYNTDIDFNKKVNNIIAVYDGICSQCSEQLFGEDHGELKDLCGTDSIAEVVCYNCGSIEVNSAGECVATDCIFAHGFRTSNDYE